jgi:ParB-like chromosome segregation protein Spo0J
LLDGRHTFAVLRDIGMEEIPVAVKNSEILTAKELDLIKNIFQ